jgi:hypothetical protein
LRTASATRVFTGPRFKDSKMSAIRIDNDFTPENRSAALDHDSELAYYR